jgi:hypothetical protein
LPVSASSLLSTIIFRFIATDFVEFEFISNTNSSLLSSFLSYVVQYSVCIENGIGC